VAVTASLSSFLSQLTPCVCGKGNALITLPAPAPNAPQLPGAGKEAAVVASIYDSRSKSLLGTSATSTAFLQMLPEFDTIHIGTHGYADRRPLQSAIDFGHIRVHAWEILNLRLTRAPVVILAGCSTANDAEGRTTISLSSAFIAAGASAVVGSLWDVEDQSTARLMINFHQHLSQGMPASEALALAQRSAIARNEHVASWAAFQVQM
jgi:CHAT domain-containing protein